MKTYKEFQGKSLDEAIQEACDHFGIKRDKLEVEIVSGGSTGIFGLVGAKKATIKARPRNAQATEKQATEKQGTEKQSTGKKEITEENLKPDTAVQSQAQDNTKLEVSRKPKPKRTSSATAKKSSYTKQAQSTQAHEKIEEEQQFVRDEKQESSLSELDAEELEQTVREVVITLIEQLVMAPKLEVKIGSSRVNILIHEPEHSGLIIGRDGQTLAALQYLVNRIVSRRMNASVRVQIDTGDYRERQDQKLKQIAKYLAEKSRKTGRTQSTKPLSSYHRRIVHLTLQEDTRVATRSKGDGAMKRVLIMPKRNNRKPHNGNTDEFGDVNGNR